MCIRDRNNGWSGAGYHFLVRKDGTVYRLRPEGKIGAHASGSNSDSIGICFEGSYMTETMPQAQINAGKELVAYLKQKYKISKVQAHREVCSTNCPGKNFPFTEIANAKSTNNTNTSASNTTVNTTCLLYTSKIISICTWKLCKNFLKRNKYPEQFYSTGKNRNKSVCSWNPKWNK